MKVGWNIKGLATRRGANYFDVQEDWTANRVLDYVSTHGKEGETLNVVCVSDLFHGCCRGTARNAFVQSAHQITSPFVEANGKGLIVSQHLTGEFPGADQRMDTAEMLEGVTSASLQAGCALKAHIGGLRTWDQTGQVLGRSTTAAWPGICQFAAPSSSAVPPPP
jgi:hypothetical protein